ncbi:hypothetical protein [Glutamicibacter creatinolyticus]
MPLPPNMTFPSPIGKLQYYMFCQKWGHRWSKFGYHWQYCRICRGTLRW